ncbi:helix-turn-helix transcriptional regulator [Maritalea porphyrae]|uniref:AraC family transcriptional regulator n=1 Tax=Maritalea porphyrae TaxID=880732 RepID=A0ABQ5UQ29_9HYPH|nr:AraC family transcriptional regulator [Maritalea porphyrae]GLQ16974.1 AraC family transcriptional regulator [Maritalea porphyrae]
MNTYDRLTALMERFNLSVQVATPDSAQLVVLKPHVDGSQTVLLNTKSSGFKVDPADMLLCASVDWGGDSNPLFSALPPILDISFSKDDDVVPLLDLTHREIERQRCGSASVVNRFCEILIVKILRAKIEQGSDEPGLLAGLADPRLSRAIVALHDKPEHNWDNQQLAEIAGLSLSRFAELFALQVGVTPTAYLRGWRMVLARKDIRAGARISTVARRYGYRTGEGFSRAFHKHFGVNPIQQRTQLALGQSH